MKRTYILFILIFLAFFSFQNKTQAQTAADPTDAIYDLNITHSSPTSVMLVWDSYNSGGSYMVTVRNASNNQIVRNLETSGTSLHVDGLEIGTKYIFTVSKNDFIIVDDTDM